MHQICVLTQYKSHSLDRHISTTWRLSSVLGQYITPVPAQQRLGRRWYTGSADAIFQSLNLVYDEEPDYIVVFGADHVYRMDPSQMLDAHIESGAGVTVAGHPGAARRGEGVRLHRLRRRPGRSPSSWRSRPTRRRCPTTPRSRSPRWATTSSPPTCCSRRCKADAEDGDSDHDMGGDIIPRLVGRGRRARLRLRRQRGARRHRARRGLLARRRHHRRLLRGAHGPRVRAPDLQPLQPALAHPHGHGAAAARQVRARAASRRTRSSARARSSPGRSCAGR